MNNDTIDRTLQEMDLLFSNFYAWLAGQYDMESGGFYYARSSRTVPGWTPDIESSAQALNILVRSGLTDAMPQPMRRAMTAFFQGKQEPGSGYFYDADPSMRQDAVMVNRALGYCTNALKRLGSRPLYPLPSAHRKLPDFMHTPAGFAEWLKGISLVSSWRGCDYLSSCAMFLIQLTDEERIPYKEALFSYLASIQDPETGLWGEGCLYIRISGTFKLNILYERMGERLPHGDRIYRTLLHCLRSDEALDMCWIRNPIDLLSSGIAEIQPEDLDEIIAITYANMHRLLREDGGFSRELKHSPPAPNVAQVKEGEWYPDIPQAVPIGLGWVEGDMNAATQALLIRHSCYALSGRTPEPLRAAMSPILALYERQEACGPRQ